MTGASAAGRKTGLAEGLLEKQISVLSTFLEDSLTKASTLDEGSDRQGWARADAVAAAVRLAKTSAALGIAVSKLRGEFTHRMIFRKEEPVTVAELPAPDAAPVPPAYEGEPPLFTDAEWKNDSLTNEDLWQRHDARMQERARRAGWIA